MSIIQLQLNKRLDSMIEEVKKEYNLTANEIILNSLDHFIKDKKDFLVGHKFELEQVVKQKQLEFAQATKALELHNARISNFDMATNVSHETYQDVVEEPTIIERKTKRSKMSFCFTDANLQSLDNKIKLCIRFAKNNVKTFYSHHINKQLSKNLIKVKIGRTDQIGVLSARKKAKENEVTVRGGISPNANKSAGRPKLVAMAVENPTTPLETDLDILGIALEDNKINVNQAKGKFLNGIYANTARQAFDMWKNDDKTIGQICKLQLMEAGTPNEKPCSVANMLLSRILKGIWHFGTPEEKGYIFNNKEVK